MKSKSGFIFLSTLIAGTLDILAAIFVYAIILEKTTAVKILQSIASGIFKKEAYTAGPQMAWYGLGLHYLIAFIFSWFYFTIYPYLPVLRKSTVISGFVYGILVWIVMNLIVLPIMFPILPEKHFDFPLLLSITILMLCIGLPIASFAKKYYSIRE
ncbi:DUF1440 domain-containing protein [Flavobacterium piscisymbiosum]|uniref:DUF1440 domain-containing protein n=1 Tax=Flavobacterium piscisymbiosum TaxID=2893753 RepID=A0ABS8MJP4_9FLAO|nr:DUF1440 domain-containing protein [Flavobacterium sp. F-30]MCC9065717.1 DUF1440 domain-containing protein [Flavobacterium sp. F-30]